MAKDRKDDLFRRSFEAGTAFLDMTRERAEALVKDFVKAGEISKGRAQKLVDEVLERSRKGTEELREVVRRELTEQVSALGLATKDDIARLQQRLDEMAAAPSAGAGVSGAGAGPASTPTSTTGAPVRKSQPRKRATGGTTPPMTPAGPADATKKAATKARAPRKTGAPAAGATGAGGTATGATPTGGPPANGPATG